MSSIKRLIGGAFWLSLWAAAVAAPTPKLKAVAVDPLLNVFQDSAVKGQKEGHADAARGEHATFQVVITSSPVVLKDVQCTVTDFMSADEKLPVEKVRFVGYVGSSYTAKTPAKDQLRKAPAMFPDPLLEDTAVTVHAGDNQPIWLTVPVPVDAKPGDYKATATVTAKTFGLDTTATLPLSLKVYPATINDTRLNVTLWFQMWHRGDQPMPEKFSPEWWDVMRTYVKTMVAHRQNWARVETTWLVKYGRDAEGKLTFDFTNFDKWVQILLDGGIKNIEGLQYAWRSGKWNDPYHVEIHSENDETSTGTRAAADSPEAEQFYSQFFPALYSHLKEKGWLDKYAQHVGDEPVKANADSYTTAAMYAKKYMPGVPIIEACLNHEMVGAVDIWVPTIEHLGKDYDFYKQRMAAGDRVWFYTCVQPQGDYANHFAELPLIKTRLVHWVNFKYNAEGYLHWGFNFWRKHPWDDIASGTLPGGDTHIVYPAKDSMGIVESMRLDAMRDGIEDHELLSQLKEKNPAKAEELAARIVKDWDDYDTNLENFRKARRELLEALSK